MNNIEDTREDLVTGLRAAISAGLHPNKDRPRIRGFLLDYSPDTKAFLRDAIVAATESPVFGQSWSDAQQKSNNPTWNGNLSDWLSTQQGLRADIGQSVAEIWFVALNSNLEGSFKPAVKNATVGSASSSTSSRLSGATSTSPATPGPVVYSDRSVSTPQSFILFFRNYLSFFGRSCRKGFWWPFLMFFVALNILEFTRLSLNPTDSIENENWTIVIVGWILLIPMISLSVRRLHDTGRRGLWLLIVPLTLGFGLILILYWAAKKGEYGPNRHGDDTEEGVRYSHPKNHRYARVMRIITSLILLLFVPSALISTLIDVTGQSVDLANISEEENASNATVVMVSFICFAVFLFLSTAYKFFNNWKYSKVKWIDFLVLSIALVVFCLDIFMADNWGQIRNGNWMPAPSDEEFSSDLWTMAAATIGCYLPLSGWALSKFR
ncbi:MAG: DUF805 domain-containing protein [Hyphomicrobiales bacterium]|uniref:DUF805 domain-containing protein n=1 Tax=Roseibium polysiphoniae TaxID=2571221 RepID=UPI0032978ECF